MQESYKGYKHPQMIFESKGGFSGKTLQKTLNRAPKLNGRNLV